MLSKMGDGGKLVGRNSSRCGPPGKVGRELSVGESESLNLDQPPKPSRRIRVDSLAKATCCSVFSRSSIANALLQCPLGQKAGVRFGGSFL